MKICVIDNCFPIDNQTHGMGATWLKWYIQKCGGELVDLFLCDCVALTCVFPDVEKTVKAIQKKTNKPIFCGGAGCLSPFSIGKFVTAVCVGNGQRFINTLCKNGIDDCLALPETWIHGESKIVVPSKGFCWDCPPIEFEQNGYRVFCGKGCKKKCGFCQTGWAVEYEENPHPKTLLAQIKKLQSEKKSFAYLSNDPMQHSFFKDLPSVEHGSYSLDFIKRNGLPNGRQIRLGVEGVSERLREYCKKPINKNDLVKATAWMNQNKKAVRWFMIAGLPTETQADWEELKESIIKWKEICHSGSLQLSFTAWCPEPSAPFGIIPLNDDYWENFVNFKDWFFDGAGWTNRIRIFNPQQPEARLEKCIKCMGLSEKELREGGHWGPNDRVAYPYKQARNAWAEKIKLVK